MIKFLEYYFYIYAIKNCKQVRILIACINNTSIFGTPKILYYSENLNRATATCKRLAYVSFKLVRVIRIFINIAVIITSNKKAHSDLPWLQ